MCKISNLSCAGNYKYNRRRNAFQSGVYTAERFASELNSNVGRFLRTECIQTVREVRGRASSGSVSMHLETCRKNRMDTSR